MNGYWHSWHIERTAHWISLEFDVFVSPSETPAWFIQCVWCKSFDLEAVHQMLTCPSARKTPTPMTQKMGTREVGRHPFLPCSWKELRHESAMLQTHRKWIQIKRALELVAPSTYQMLALDGQIYFHILDPVLIVMLVVCPWRRPMLAVTPEALCTMESMYVNVPHLLIQSIEIHSPCLVRRIIPVFGLGSARALAKRGARCGHPDSGNWGIMGDTVIHMVSVACGDILDAGGFKIY